MGLDFAHRGITNHLQPPLAAEYLLWGRFCLYIPLQAVINRPQTHVLVRIEAIITSLVFDHALRVRLKAETSDGPEGAEDTAPRRPASDAKGTTTVEQSSHRENDDTNTLHSQDATAASSTAADTADATEISNVKSKDSKQESPKKDNFMGKVQNLVTSDLDNITGGRNFLFVGKPISFLCSTLRRQWILILTMQWCRLLYTWLLECGSSMSCWDGVRSLVWA